MIWLNDIGLTAKYCNLDEEDTYCLYMGVMLDERMSLYPVVVELWTLHKLSNLILNLLEKE